MAELTVKNTDLSKLAIQALRYLSSLNKPLPEKTDTDFYTQNETDYQALLTLNNLGLGTTEGELFTLALDAQKALENVFIITRAERQSDDTFSTFIASVWTSIEAARADLRRIKGMYESNDDLKGNWRAVTPCGQVDDLSVELYDGKFYNCKSFFKISDYKVMAEA